jgi:formiminotetrahydrofolate cyclodeaminase
LEQQELITNDGVLLSRPTYQLLNDFGAGRAAPGSGSAAALLSLPAAKMICTVCEISLRKSEDKTEVNQFKFIKSSIEDEIEPRLKQLFESDAKDFERVIQLRRSRDQAVDPLDKAKFSREASDLLETATNYTFEVGDMSLRLMGFGVYVFEKGWHAVRGDSGVALSAAMSGLMSSIFIINLNLKTLHRRKYAKENLDRCQVLQIRLNELQTEAFSCVTDISAESLSFVQLDLPATD